MRYAMALTLALGLAAQSLAAQEAQSPAEGSEPPALGTTAEWLELQRTRIQAGEANPIPGEAAEKIYQRYLNSFDHPIPERFPTAYGTMR